MQENQEREKNKLVNPGVGIHQLKSQIKSAAATRPAGTGTASATTNGVGGCDSKTGTGTRVDKLNFDGTAGIHKTFFNQKSKIILVVNIVIIFWLIQSQSQ